MSKGKNKGKKAKPRKDQSARIARGAARKKANREANELRNLANGASLSSVGILPGKGKNRPSVQLRRLQRANAERVIQDIEGIGAA